MSVRNRNLSASMCLVVLVAMSGISPTMAQVPVNDAARTTEETKTAVCVQRARTFKQSSVAPSRGVTSSVTAKGDLAGIPPISGAAISGSPLSGTAIGTSDLSILLATGSSVQALKTRNIGQVVSALAATAAAISANTSTLQNQAATIGNANSCRAPSTRTPPRACRAPRSGTRRSSRRRQRFDCETSDWSTRQQRKALHRKS